MLAIVEGEVRAKREHKDNTARRCLAVRVENG